MASKEKNNNGSQFFITFDGCEDLNKEHTVFGKIVGDTIYNLLRMENLEVDSNNAPLNPPTILDCNVIENPFADLFPRSLEVSRPDLYLKSKSQNLENQKSLKAKKPAKKKAVLTFDEDEEEEEEIQIGKNKTNKETTSISPFDLINNDPTLSKEEALTQKEKDEIQKKEEGLKLESQILNKMENPLEENNEFLGKRSKLEDSLIGDLKGTQESLQGLKVQKSKKTGKLQIKFSDNSDDNNSQKNDNSSSTSSSSDSDDEDDNNSEGNTRKKQIDEYEKIKMEMLKFKREEAGMRSLEDKMMEKQGNRQLGLLDLKRYKYLKEKRKLGDEETLKKMQDFKNRVLEKKQGKKYHWMKNKLKFHVDSDAAFQLQEKKAIAEKAFFKVPDYKSTEEKLGGEGSGELGEGSGFKKVEDILGVETASEIFNKS